MKRPMRSQALRDEPPGAIGDDRQVYCRQVHADEAAGAVAGQGLENQRGRQAVVYARLHDDVRLPVPNDRPPTSEAPNLEPAFSPTPVYRGYLFNKFSFFVQLSKRIPDVFVAKTEQRRAKCDVSIHVRIEVAMIDLTGFTPEDV